MKTCKDARYSNVTKHYLKLDETVAISYFEKTIFKEKKPVKISVHMHHM